MITKDSIEQAFCFFHQKGRIYSFSTDAEQKDHIEYTIASYVEGMNPDLYLKLARGREHFLTTHRTFADDLSTAVTLLEQMMQEKE